MSSIYSPVPIEQDLSFLIIGERTNANGSKAFRDAMLAGDWDTCTKMANEQVREGAHVLDVCVDYVGRDGAVDMDEIAKRFATQASVPLVMDSTESPVLEAGLQHIGGRAILNSANLEDGELPGSRFDRVMSLARDYGAAVICLLIDERGQARDVEWKMEIAHRIHEIATERYGLSASRPHLRRPDVPAVDRRRRPAPGRHVHDRGDPADQGRDPRRPHHARRVQRQLRPQPGRPATPSTACSSTSACRPGSTRRSSTPARSCRSTGCPTSSARSASTSSTTAGPTRYDPLQQLLEVFADVKSTKTEKADRSGQPVQERLHHRIIDGDRDGLTADLDEALAAGHRRRSTSSTTSCSAA